MQPTADGTGRGRLMTQVEDLDSPVIRARCVTCKRAPRTWLPVNADPGSSTAAVWSSTAAVWSSTPARDAGRAFVGPPHELSPTEVQSLFGESPGSRRCVPGFMRRRLRPDNPRVQRRAPCPESSGRRTSGIYLLLWCGWRGAWCGLQAGVGLFAARRALRTGGSGVADCVLHGVLSRMCRV